LAQRLVVYVDPVEAVFGNDLKEFGDVPVLQFGIAKRRIGCVRVAGYGEEVGLPGLLRLLGELVPAAPVGLGGKAYRVVVNGEPESRD
jgi:hypothetical protein